MKRDVFSCCHPAVNFLFFVLAIGFGVVIQHPAFLAAGAFAAAVYYVLLRGTPGLKMLLSMLPLFLAVTVLNPLINRQGNTVLFVVFSIPYTLEALVYGAVLAGMFLAMVLWFGCYSQVMTGDKFTSLFGNLIPSLSLLLVMIFRMVPDLIRKGHQILYCRKSIGKGAAEEGSLTKRIKDGVVVLGCLTSWAFEGGIVTADSMRSRGYGSAKRTSFAIYRMRLMDWQLTGVILLLAAVVLWGILSGHTAASFTPDWEVAPVSFITLLAYLALTMIPALLYIEEAIKWHISRSRI